MEQAIPPVAPNRCSLAEYFVLAEESEAKLEYHNGKAIAMAGGTESHSLITTNVIGELRNRLRDKPCRVYDSNLRVTPEMRKKYYYPDALVVFGDREFDPNDPRKITVSNPAMIVEVLSDSTENYDRDKKFMAYIKAESLKEYLLIAQDTPHAQTYFRQPDGSWSFAFTEGINAVVKIRSLQIDLPLSEVYAKVEMPAVEDESET